jgi:hypothetical protein
MKLFKLEISPGCVLIFFIFAFAVIAAAAMNQHFDALKKEEHRYLQSIESLIHDINVAPKPIADTLITHFAEMLRHHAAIAHQQEQMVSLGVSFLIVIGFTTFLIVLAATRSRCNVMMQPGNYLSKASTESLKASTAGKHHESE